MYTLTMLDTLHNRSLWEDKYQDLELVAGLIAAGVSMVNAINRRQKLTQYALHTNADIQPFVVLKNVSEDDINKSSCGGLQAGEYGVWLMGENIGRYHLYRFRNASFMQGVVSMFTAFQIDFRDYLWGLPFNSKMKKLIMWGYIMTSDQMAIDTPDLDDVDDERADDENFIQPLTKDYGEYRD